MKLPSLDVVSRLSQIFRIAVYVIKLHWLRQNGIEYCLKLQQIQTILGMKVIDVDEGRMKWKSIVYGIYFSTFAVTISA